MLYTSTRTTRTYYKKYLVRVVTHSFRCATNRATRYCFGRHFRRKREERAEPLLNVPMPVTFYNQPRALMSTMKCGMEKKESNEHLQHYVWHSSSHVVPNVTQDDLMFKSLGIAALELLDEVYV